MNLSARTVDDVVVIGFEEEMSLDSSNADEFREEVARFVEGENKLLIDLGRVSFVDSSGIGALVAIWRSATRSDGDLRLTSIRPAVRTVFEITRLHRVFEIYEAEEEAIASFQA